MGFADNMRTLSNINATLASLVTYGQQRQSGVPAQTAAMNLFGNMANGYIRNDIAYGMQKMGNPVGNTINLYAGYGNPTSNYIGTTALFTANINPWMMFNCYSYMPPMPMMGGFYSNMGMGFGMMPVMYSHGFLC